MPPPWRNHRPPTACDTPQHERPLPAADRAESTGCRNTPIVWVWIGSPGGADAGVGGRPPARWAGLVRRVAESVVRAHDERSLTGVVAPVPDAAGVVGELITRVSGFGPQRYLVDPEVEEVGSTTRAGSSWPGRASTS